MASIGVAVSAHQPQPARPMYSATTMKRFFSDSSISRLIMDFHASRPAHLRSRAHDIRHAVQSGTAIPPRRVPPGSTHDD
jgi:hypothetical protein